MYRLVTSAGSGNDLGLLSNGYSYSYKRQEAFTAEDDQIRIFGIDVRLETGNEEGEMGGGRAAEQWHLCIYNNGPWCLVSGRAIEPSHVL